MARYGFGQAYAYFDSGYMEPQTLEASHQGMQIASGFRLKGAPAFGGSQYTVFSSVDGNVDSQNPRWGIDFDDYGHIDNDGYNDAEMSSCVQIASGYIRALKR